MQILPVIHHLDADTTVAQAQLAGACGADGVFLISHDGRDTEILSLVEEVREEFIAASRRRLGWVGVNLLGIMSPSHAMTLALQDEADGLWLDRPGFDSQHVDPAAMRMARALREMPPDSPTFHVFAGVAFKGQPVDPDPVAAACNAGVLGFVPTTSGVATGHAPDVDHVAAMAASFRDGIAVASGLTPENIAAFVPHLSHALVATGVSRDFHHFDAQRLRDFVRNVRAAQEAASFF